MTAPTIDLNGFAPRQPFADLPNPGFDWTYGAEHCDIGEDGDMLILGHVGTLRAVAVFRARLRYLWSLSEADDFMRGVEHARTHVEHLWAVLVPHCTTYPMCRSLGLVGDGEPSNPCIQCREIDDAGGFYLEWDATKDTPGAFPVTLWRAWVTEDNPRLSKDPAPEVDRRLLDHQARLVATDDGDGARVNAGIAPATEPVVHLVVGPREYIGLRAQGWIACDPGGQLAVPMAQRTRDEAKATCPACRSAIA